MLLVLLQYCIQKKTKSKHKKNLLHQSNTKLYQIKIQRMSVRPIVETLLPEPLFSTKYSCETKIKNKSCAHFQITGSVAKLVHSELLWMVRKGKFNHAKIKYHSAVWNCFDSQEVQRFQEDLQAQANHVVPEEKHKDNKTDMSPR